MALKLPELRFSSYQFSAYADHTSPKLEARTEVWVNFRFVAKSRVIYPGPPRTWDPLTVSGTHTIPISLGILMGVVWEAYHKGVPLLGVPENPID